MADRAQTLTTFLTEIADAIRYVKGTTDLIDPRDFASLIRGMFKSIGQISDNVITLISSLIEDGTYTLSYVNESGAKLENFGDICTLVVNGADVSYRDFITENIPPYAADKIGVYNDNELVGLISLAGFKPEYGERLYRFGLLSDVHDYEGSAAEPSDDFQRALALFNEKEDVVMTCICGDISENGTASEFQMYLDDIATKSPDTPVYTTTGNHDCVQGASSIDVDQWVQYTGQPLTFEVSRELSNGKTDHFLFLGMKAWNYTTPYNSSDIDWLANKLESYKNERCFVFTHLFFPSRAGNFKSIYPSYNWLSGEQLTRLENLNDSYKNSIWFSGHSHWKWYLQKYEDNANIWRSYNSAGEPQSGWCVHVPSCASPIDSDGVSSRDAKPLESEGAIVDVYENYIDIRGIDLKNNLYLPIATYRLITGEVENEGGGTTPPIIEEENQMHSTEFKANNYISTNNTSTYPKVEYDSATDTIKITFSQGSQKLLYESTLLTDDLTSADIKISCDSVTYSSNGSPVELSDADKLGLGFYKADGSYGIDVDYGELSYPTTLDTTQTYPTNSLQFNSSGSKYSGSYPITIEMTGLKLHIKGEGEVVDPDPAPEPTTNYLTIDDFTYNSEKNHGALIEAADNDYIKATFTGTSQGYLVDVPEGASTCTVHIEDISITANGNAVDTMAKCGFYTTSSGYTLTDGDPVRIKDGKVEFQTSSSCSGPFPIVITMKAWFETT